MSIAAAGTAIVLNDIVNANLRRRDDEAHNQAIAASGFLDNTFGLVAAVRPRRIPVFWVRVARRADKADVPDNQVDAPGAWHGPAPITEGSYEGSFLDEVVLA